MLDSEFENVLQKNHELKLELEREEANVQWTQSEYEELIQLHEKLKQDVVIPSVKSPESHVCKSLPLVEAEIEKGAALRDELQEIKLVISDLKDRIETLKAIALTESVKKIEIKYDNSGTVALLKAELEEAQRNLQAHRSRIEQEAENTTEIIYSLRGTIDELREQLEVAQDDLLVKKAQLDQMDGNQVVSSAPGEGKSLFSELDDERVKAEQRVVSIREKITSQSTTEQDKLLNILIEVHHLQQTDTASQEVECLSHRAFLLQYENKLLAKNVDQLKHDLATLKSKLSGSAPHMISQAAHLVQNELSDQLEAEEARLKECNFRLDCEVQLATQRQLELERELKMLELKLSSTSTVPQEEDKENVKTTPPAKQHSFDPNEFYRNLMQQKSSKPSK